MFISHIFETPQHDLDNLRIAQRASSLFSGWLTRKNEHTPLKDCGMWQRTISGFDCWIIKASEVGIDDDRLYLGIGHSTTPTPTGAFATTGRDSEGPLTFLIVSVQRDPADQTDVSFGISWTQFIHEYQHVLDYRRGYTRHRDNMDRIRTKNGTQHLKPKLNAILYFNSPIEFNGYYTQGLDQILHQLVRQAQAMPDQQEHFRDTVLRDRESFWTSMRGSFNLDWLHYLNPLYRRKLTKRVAKLYMLIRTEWPNMEAIHDIEAENKRLEAEWLARSAAEEASQQVA